MSSGGVCDEDGVAVLLRAYRVMAGLTQEQLSDRAGLSVRALSNLESGRSLPRLATLHRLAAALALARPQLEPMIAALVAHTVGSRPAAPMPDQRGAPHLIRGVPEHADADDDVVPQPPGHDQSDAMLAARYLVYLGDQSIGFGARLTAEAAYREAIHRLQRAGHAHEAATIRQKLDRLRHSDIHSHPSVAADDR